MCFLNLSLPVLPQFTNLLASPIITVSSSVSDNLDQLPLDHFAEQLIIYSSMAWLANRRCHISENRAPTVLGPSLSWLLDFLDSSD